MAETIDSDSGWKFTLAAQMSLDGFWEWDLPSGRVTYSARWQCICGYPALEVSAGLEHWIDRVHPQDHAGLINDLRALRKGYARTMHNEHRVREATGGWRWVSIRAQLETSLAGVVQRIAGVLTDETRFKTIDALTGLPNRQAFIDHVDARIESARITGSWNFAVVSLLLEQFKQVNERLGYPGGDALLIETARRLTAIIPAGCNGQSSLVSRLGGAEFLLSLENIHVEAQAQECAQSILQHLRQPFTWGRRRFQPAVVLGINRATSRAFRSDDLMHEADTALIEARSLTTTRLVCYSSGMRERALARHQMENDLDLAIHNGHLILHYQPEIELRSRRIVGFEALVRWDHPERGLIPPGEFITLAEETGLIHALGEWGLKEACRQLVEWNGLAGLHDREGAQLQKSSLRVSVNLSAEEFGRPGLVPRIADLLATYGVAPSALCLEVTESSLMVHAEEALETMEALRALGVGLHMDDFGTGYSSLNYLHRFPFDTLKIDRSFVRALFNYKGSSEIVRSIVDLAHSLGMVVVAEGIETDEQLQHLQSLNCQLGQGYLFARPMPAQDVSAMLLAAPESAGQSVAAAS